MFQFKYVFVLFVILISLIIGSIYTRRFFENFVSYKSHLVQLKKEVTNPIVIAVGNENEYISNFSKAYSYKFPMLRYNNFGGTFENLKLLNDGKCDMCITQLEMVECLYKGKTPYSSKNKDIRIVCNLNDTSLIFMANQNLKISDTVTYIDGETGEEKVSVVNSYVHMTLGQIRDYSQTNSLTIAVDNSDGANESIILKILQLYKFNMDNITILQEDIFNDTTVLTQFQNGEIDILVANIIHPDDRIKELYQEYKVQFIGIDDLDLSNIHISSPYYKRGSLNLMDYDVELFKTRMLDVFSCPLSIICNSSMDETSVYRFVSGLFENIEYLRKNYKKINKKVEKDDIGGLLANMDYYKIRTYKDTSARQIDSLLPSSYYNIKSIIPIHEGTKTYLKKIGLITYIDNDSCKNYLPDGNPSNMQNFFENCNSNPILTQTRHHGHGNF
jgi:TRAP-type uncharacterized transport system substrate-binding protein